MNSADLAKKIVAKMLERKILINRTSETVLRFLRPTSSGREHVDMAISALNEILTEKPGAPTPQASKGGHGMASKTLCSRRKSSTSGGQYACSSHRDSLAGRDLCSIADLSQLEIAAILELAHAIKASPGGLSLFARCPADGDVLRKGVAAHPPDL